MFIWVVYIVKLTSEKKKKKALNLERFEFKFF